MYIKIFNKKEFYNHFKINENRKWWDYFEKNFKYFMFPIPENAIFYVLFDDNNQPIWVAQLLKQTFKEILELPYNDLTETTALCFLTIHPKYRWNKYSTLILDKILSNLILKKWGLFYSSYFTESGKKTLRKNMIELCNKYKLKLYVSWEWLLN